MEGVKMPQSSKLFAIEAGLRPFHNSPLVRKGGFDVFQGLPEPKTFDLMLSEATSVFPTAQVSDVAVSDREEIRGGNPARRFLSAPGGSVQDAFYNATWMIDFLRGVTGTFLIPAGRRGTYTYYARPGDYLALHRDVETCDVAVITCLYNNAGLADGGGVLNLYPDRLFEKLSVIRETPEHGVTRIRLLPGQTLVMLGGIIPHALMPVNNKQVRIISVLCYGIDP
jgi:hypothetical protein